MGRLRPAGPPKRSSIFLEDWWLDAATGGAWGAVSIERGGRLEAWLPYALFRKMGFSRCGIPLLSRLTFPMLQIDAPKGETFGRTRFQLETELIARLPRASSYEFILPPDDGNALAWQAQGFDARVMHTFVIDRDTTDAVMWMSMRSKTRNLIRRAEEALTARAMSADDFVRQYESNLVVDAEHVACVRRLAHAVIERDQGRAMSAVDAEGRTHAAVLFVWDEHDYYYYLSTRNADLAELGAVGMLVWTGMTDAMSRGLRFDFDGVSNRNRLRFLQSFGGRLANRLVVTRGSAAYEARLLMRYLRGRLASNGPTERFS